MIRPANCGTLIVGAGLAGLSAAFHLGERRHRLIERESSAGGLCRSIRTNGFTFDYTGHLLHMRRPEIRELVFSLLDEESFLRIDRRAGIYSHGTYTEYPFQVNTHGLPTRVVRDCVMGFADTLQRHPSLGEDPSFHDWALATFGEGICRHFLFPYNAKLFRADLRSMTADWCSWSIPKPTWTDVVRGAQGLNRKAFGYNPQFLYPAGGGIDHLPRAFLRHVNAPSFETSLESLDVERREARLSSGEVTSFDTMISTIPLPQLLGRIEGLPETLAEACSRLRFVSVRNLNLGFDAVSPEPYHWVYFPEAQFPFYRVGIYSNLCSASVPANRASFYVEISRSPGDAPDGSTPVEACAEALRHVGLVPEGARLVEACAVDIPCAYVVHDAARRSALPAIERYLESHGILSVGRYGAWEYSAMEDALWHGRAAAERAIARSSPRA